MRFDDLIDRVVFAGSALLLPLSVAAVTFLAGCSTVPAVEVVRVTPPEALLAACPVPDRDVRTNGDLAALVLDLREAMGLCNDQLQTLREWVKED